MTKRERYYHYTPKNIFLPGVKRFKLRDKYGKPIKFKLVRDFFDYKKSMMDSHIYSKEPGKTVTITLKKQNPTPG